MPSVANINGVDLSKYKIVRKGQFVFSGMQTGRDKCIRIALFDKDEPVIISPAYTVLEIKDNSVLVEYIMMWFLRKEVDRLGWFMSDGSIRTNLDMDRFYEIEIPVPDLNVQKSIVQIYNAYNERRDINEKLKEQIKDICPILIKGSIEEARKAKEA
ncbi:restriction endonuclease subunit S [Blautia sp. TF12-31AT]|nr:restriction endonuclease subunit S [Blautia sp. TF12-31AT]